MERDDRIKWNVFQGASTYSNDYRKPELIPRPSSNFPRATREPPEKLSKKYVPIDHETFIPWKSIPDVPFDLYHTPKAIIGVNPKPKIQMPKPIVDHGKENAIKTRPRIYMKSAISLDDIPDPEMRKFVCDALYTTDGRMAEKEAIGNFQIKPLSKISIGEDVTFAIEPDLFPDMPKHFNNKDVEWDEQQTRSIPRDKQIFWSTTKLPTRDGGPLTNLVPEATKKEIRKLIEEESLRLPHDYPKPLYAGYKPMLSYGIPLRKKVEAITHPFLSTSQAITKRYEN